MKTFLIAMAFIAATILTVGAPVLDTIAALETRKAQISEVF